MLMICSQEVMWKKETMCAPISFGTSSKKSILISAQQWSDLCRSRSTSAVLPNGRGMSGKVNQSRSFQVRRERKRSSGLLSLWKYPKKEFSAICKWWCFSPSEAPQRSLLHFMLNSQMFQRAVFSHMLSRFHVTRPEHNLQLGGGETLWCVTFLLSQSLPTVGSGPTIGKVMLRRPQQGNCDG